MTNAIYLLYRYRDEPYAALPYQHFFDSIEDFNKFVSQPNVIAIESRYVNV